MFRVQVLRTPEHVWLSKSVVSQPWNSPVVVVRPASSSLQANTGSVQRNQPRWHTNNVPLRLSSCSPRFLRIQKNRSDGQRSPGSYPHDQVMQSDGFYLCWKRTPQGNSDRDEKIKISKRFLDALPIVQLLWGNQGRRWMLPSHLCGLMSKVERQQPKVLSGPHKKNIVDSSLRIRIREAQTDRYFLMRAP